MAGPDGHGGINVNLPGGRDVARDFIALVLAVIRGDEEAQKVIRDNADRDGLLSLSMAALASALTYLAGGDPDAPPSALTGEQLQAIEEALITGIRELADDPGPGP
jgi:hypothetical protein